MECNKDEARRAMDIAERKVTENNFTEAKRFATKAQNLFPQVDGLKQLLMVIDVYISAANKINGGEADWYGILGVDPLADDDALKKQYRKLALMLHPDKNKCKGAEGAFKLVLEAWSLLSDKAKRLVYNQKRMTNEVQQTKSRRKPPPQSASKGAQNGRDGGATSGRKRKGQQTKNDMKPPAQPASKGAENARENAASSGRESEKGQQPKSEMKPPPQPASNGAQNARGSAASTGRKSERGQQTKNEMKPPPQPASNGMKPPHQPASNETQNVKDSAAFSGRARSKSATAPVDSSSTNRKVKNISTFRTMCNGCKTEYHFVKAFYFNRALVCPNCRQAFIATEITPQPSVVKPVNLSVPQQHEAMDSSNTPNAVNQTHIGVKRGGLEESQAKDAATKVTEKIVKKRRRDDSYVAASNQGMT